MIGEIAGFLSCSVFKYLPGCVRAVDPALTGPMDLGFLTIRKSL